MKGKEHFQFPKYCSILPLPCVIRSSQCLLSYYCCISKKDLCLKSYTISIHTTPSNDSYSKLITKTFLSHKDLPALIMTPPTDGLHFHQISDCLICFKTGLSKFTAHVPHVYRFTTLAHGFYNTDQPFYNTVTTR